jgi:hypothetical protein
MLRLCTVFTRIELMLLYVNSRGAFETNNLAKAITASAIKNMFAVFEEHVELGSKSSQLYLSKDDMCRMRRLHLDIWGKKATLCTHLSTFVKYTLRR